MAAYDPMAAMSSPFLQPATGMSAISVAFALLAQASPRDFVPERYLGRLVSGVKAERFILFPASTAALLYGAVAVQTFEGNYIRGHAAGLAVSGAVSLGLAKMLAVSPWYWLLFAGFSAYGALHHGRRLSLYSDGATWYRQGDAGRVWRHWSTTRADAKRKEAQIVRLRAERRDEARKARAAKTA
jgi:hypothetical protein